MGSGLDPSITPPKVIADNRLVLRTPAGYKGHLINPHDSHDERGCEPCRDRTRRRAF
jgi:hypothetical protein